MAGRRLREAVKSAVQDMIPNAIVITAGLSNAYSEYCTTIEEYAEQRYEGASTLFGPHQLEALTEVAVNLAKALVHNTTVAPGSPPQNMKGKVPNFFPGVVLDTAPIGKEFGDLETDVPAGSFTSGDSVEAVFWGAHPRNSVMRDPHMMSVERVSDTGEWVTYMTDTDWSTLFHWKRHDISESHITITWNIPSDVEAGTYRLRVFGSSKNLLGHLSSYSGASRDFEVN
jgi:neutral ceramidase